MLCPRTVCLLVKMCNFFCQVHFKTCANSRIQSVFQSYSSYLRIVKSPAPCCDFMSFGEMVRSGHQISAELAEKYRKDILEGPPRLAVSASCSTLNFPMTHSFSIESCVGFAVGFAWLGIASSLLNLVNTA